MTGGMDFLLALGALLIFIVLFMKFKVNRPQRTYVSDIPKIFATLKREGQDASFVIFIFMPGQADKNADEVNIQFSIDQGQIGLDWVLLGGTNVRDAAKVRDFMESRGFEVVDKEMNDVKYLRVVKGGDLAQLCQDIIHHIYQHSSNNPLETVVEGISMPG